MSMTPEEPRRGPGRPPLHPQEPIRPPIRPDQSRPSLRDRLRATTRKYTVNSDRFYIAPEDKPEGVSLNWKRHTVQGQEDPFYLANMRQQGWEPVDAQDMPNLVPEGFTGSIIKDGMILMARRQELTDQAEAEVKRLSTRQVSDRERQMGISPNGQAPRTAPEIKKELMRPVPVEED